MPTASRVDFGHVVHTFQRTSQQRIVLLCASHTHPRPLFVAPPTTTRFNDLNSIDKISGVQAKVNAVTGVMQKNIETAMRNTDRIEDIDDKAVVLAEGASKFNKAATQLKRNMRCRYWKMILLFTLLIVAILCAIIIPIALQARK